MTEHHHHSREPGSPAQQMPAGEFRPETARDDLRTVPLDAGPHAETADHVETTLSVVREGIRRHGEPFLAYLILDGVDQRSPDLVEEYERSYIGHFPDRVAFTIDRIEHNNWDGTVELFLERLGLPSEVVRWDYEELWEHLAETYRVTERLGGVHAFER